MAVKLTLEKPGIPYVGAAPLWGLASLLLAILLLSGCATPLQTRDLLNEPPDELPRQVELDQTPFHPQELYQCGPAALATVLGARGLIVHPDDLVEEVYLPERQGTLQTEMLAAAR
ncbi:MAG: hypothetical protein EA372_02275, partial [Chromatiaceae bacterium]